MARINYIDISRPDVAPAADKIKAEHGSVTPLHRILLNSPLLALSWRGLMQAVRHQCSLPGSLRELIILRVAFLNHAPYAVGEHVPIALKEGLTQAQVDGLARIEIPDMFDDRQNAVIAYTDAMTREVVVPKAVFAKVRDHFDDKELVELTATIASYNMVSRVLVAFEVNNRDPL